MRKVIRLFLREWRQWGLRVAIDNMLFYIVAYDYDHMHRWNDGDEEAIESLKEVIASA